MTTAGKETMTDAAYRCMSQRKTEVEFARLWAEVAEVMHIPEEQLTRKKRQFYNELIEDRRFAALKGNKWDLRSRRKFEEVNSDTADLEDDSDEEAEENAEDETLDIPNGFESY